MPDRGRSAIDTSAEAHAQRAFTAFQDGDYASAAATWILAASTVLDNAQQLHRHLGSAGVALARQGQPQQAIPLLQQASASWSRLLATELGALLIDCLGWTGQHDEAWKLLPTGDQVVDGVDQLATYRAVFRRHWPELHPADAGSARALLVRELQLLAPWSQARLTRAVHIIDADGEVFEVDVSPVGVPATSGIGPSDRWFARHLDSGIRAPIDTGAVLRWHDLAVAAVSSIQALRPAIATWRPCAALTTDIAQHLSVDPAVELLRRTGSRLELSFPTLGCDVELHLSSDAGSLNGAIRIFHGGGDSVEDQQRGQLPWSAEAVGRWLTHVVNRWHEQRRFEDPELARRLLIDRLEAADYEVLETIDGIEIGVGRHELILLVEDIIEDALLPQDHVLIHVHIKDASGEILDSDAVKLSWHNVRAGIEAHLPEALKDTEFASSFPSAASV